METCQPNSILQITACSTSRTPSRKKKRRNNTDNNYCGKCNIPYRRKMHNGYVSIWINCSTKTYKYWVHLILLKLQKIILKDITPIKSYNHNVS